MITADSNILLVGCGKMGGTLIHKWQEFNLYKELVIVEPENIRVDRAERVPSRADIPGLFTPDVVVFAVKPQTLPEIVAQYRNYADLGAVIISIVAGKPITFFEQHLGNNARIVRCMPNTPAAVGRGITVACKNARAGQKEKDITLSLLGSVGDLVWVEDEKILNPVTALSGSGPAYVFLLIETLTKAGIRIGLDAKLAEKLARQTVIGSAALVQSSKNLPAEKLRENVTSPGGTTQAALEVLMKEPALQDLFDRALLAAEKRAEELAK